MSIDKRIGFGHGKEVKGFIDGLTDFDKFMMMMTEKQVIHIKLNCRSSSITTITGVEKKFMAALTEEENHELQIRLNGVAELINTFLDENEALVKYLMTPTDAGKDFLGDIVNPETGE